MKRVFFIILFMVSALMSQAQTIHWLTFIDTTDDDVGRIDILGRQVLYNRFINVVNAALSPAGYKSEIKDFYGSRTTPDNCVETIENFQCDENDIIVFYYIGHGTRSKEDPTPFPQMMLASSNMDKFIPLSWVHEKLMKTNARLTITIGMCCNVVQDVTPKLSPIFSVNYGNTYVDDTSIMNIQKLFLEQSGNIIIASASPTQSSIAIPVTTDIVPAGKYIDLFTTSLIYIFDYQVKNNQNISWISILDNLKSYVDEASLGKQTPYYEIDVNGVQRCEVNLKTEIETPPLEQSDNDEDKLNFMVLMLDYIVNPNNSEENRIEFAELFIEAYLNGDTEVKILGQDGDIVVDKELGIDFIRRIATSSLLLKVAIESCTYSESGEGIKIEEMRVREIYKQTNR